MPSAFLNNEALRNNLEIVLQELVKQNMLPQAALDADKKDRLLDTCVEVLKKENNGDVILKKDFELSAKKIALIMITTFHLQNPNIEMTGPGKKFLTDNKAALPWILRLIKDVAPELDDKKFLDDIMGLSQKGPNSKPGSNVALVMDGTAVQDKFTTGTIQTSPWTPDELRAIGDDQELEVIGKIEEAISGNLYRPRNTPPGMEA